MTVKKEPFFSAARGFPGGGAVACKEATGPENLWIL